MEETVEVMGGGGQKYVWFDCSGLTAPFTREGPRLLGKGGDSLTLTHVEGGELGREDVKRREREELDGRRSRQM